MFGNSGKIGRGGGRGSKRIHNSFPPPPSNRSAAAVGSGRLSMGGAAPRNRNANPEHATSATPAVEETFKLITGNPLNFAMIIRLAPDLIEEIKRVEAQGGTARIKFGSNANNPSGNVCLVSRFVDMVLYCALNNWFSSSINLYLILGTKVSSNVVLFSFI